LGPLKKAPSIGNLEINQKIFFFLIEKTKWQNRKINKSPLNFGFCLLPTLAIHSSGPSANFQPLLFHLTVFFTILF
jgi:hypothetical protein